MARNRDLMKEIKCFNDWQGKAKIMYDMSDSTCWTDVFANDSDNMVYQSPLIVCLYSKRNFAGRNITITYDELLKRAREEFSIELGEPEKVATITIDELIELLKQSSAERGAVTGDFNGAYYVLKSHYSRYKESGGMSMEDFDFICGMLYGLCATDFIVAKQLDAIMSDLIAMN